MDPPESGRRRFAPIPIETTFEQYRKNGTTSGPSGELTPSPSPRSASSPASPALEQRQHPQQRDKRRFAPQLVESSIRRSRRAGDIGPATRHTDRTDITPYTNHIYVPRARRKHDSHSRAPPEKQEEEAEEEGDKQEEDPSRGLARRESCDDDVAVGVFDLVARDAKRKLQEIAMSAFPNSNIRIGGAEHYYVREGSDSDEAPRGRLTTRGPGQRRPSRRNSSEVGWAVKEMQEHAEVLSKMRSDRISTLELDNLELEGPPDDPMWTTATRSSVSGPSSRPVGEQHVPLITEQSLSSTKGDKPQLHRRSPSPSPIRPIGENFMPYIPTAPSGKAADMPYAPASQIPAETGFRAGAGGFNRGPFGGFRYGPMEDFSPDRERRLHRLRATKSPPMLGKDLTFRRCPSPQQTKLEPDHMWDVETGTTVDPPNRDTSGGKGLWHGYCFTSDQDTAVARLYRPAMISTPLPISSPGDPFAAAFGSGVGSGLSSTGVPLSEEPTPDDTHKASLKLGVLPSEYRARPGGAANGNGVPDSRGIHMLHGLDERLKREKAAAERAERVRSEFDDKFVDQVYNYLSLGYPAMARDFDDELSKISGISVEDLRRDDIIIMDGIAERDRPGEETGEDSPDGLQKKKRKVGARGHIVNTTDPKVRVKREDAEDREVDSKAVKNDDDDRCLRWEALKLYAQEWATQHPDLDEISPLAWGVRERRGSWGI